MFSGRALSSCRCLPLSSNVRPHNQVTPFTVWIFFALIAQVAALLYLAAVLARAERELSTLRGIVVATALWAVSCIGIVALLLVVAEGRSISRFGGHVLGSALTTSVPFIALLVLRPVFDTGLTEKRSRKIALGSAAVLCCLVMPLLFYAGWIGGCVAIGQQACL